MTRLLARTVESIRLGVRAQRLVRVGLGGYLERYIALLERFARHRGAGR